MSIFRGEQDGGCLELPKSWDYTDYDNLVHTITHAVGHTHCANTCCLYNTVLEYQCMQ